MPVSGGSHNLYASHQTLPGNTSLYSTDVHQWCPLAPPSGGVENPEQPAVLGAETSVIYVEPDFSRGMMTTYASQSVVDWLNNHIAETHLMPVSQGNVNSVVPDEEVPSPDQFYPHGTSFLRNDASSTETEHGWLCVNGAGVTIRIDVPSPNDDVVTYDLSQSSQRENNQETTGYFTNINAYKNHNSTDSLNRPDPSNYEESYCIKNDTSKWLQRPDFENVTGTPPAGHCEAPPVTAVTVIEPISAPLDNTASCSDKAQYCYDIDLDVGGLENTASHQTETTELDELTPSLPAHCLGNLNIILWPDAGSTVAPSPRSEGSDPTTFTKLRILSRDASESQRKPMITIKTEDVDEVKDHASSNLDHSNNNSAKNSCADSAIHDMSEGSFSWDEADFRNCVKYSDVHIPLDQREFLPDQYLKDESRLGRNATSSTVKRERVLKKKRDDGRLKRPKNGFIRFAMEHRKEVAKNHPRLDNREISRILGVRWRKLSQEERQNYEKQFQAEMSVRKLENPEWRYGGSRHAIDTSTWEPIPSRLRPRDKLKRKQIPRLTRPYIRRKLQILQMKWVQCDRCDKWRQLPHNIDTRDMPDKWFCEYNLPPKNYCEAEEDVEDSDDEIEYEGPSRRPQRLLGDFVTF